MTHAEKVTERKRRYRQSICGVSRLLVAEHRAHGAMISRCERPSYHRFHRYGGRGIRVCAKWRASFQAFLADVGCRPTPSHSIDRIDPDGHYEPGNVRWATATEQARNRSNNRLMLVNGQRMTAAEAAERFGLPQHVIRDRLRLGGLSDLEAVTRPFDITKSHPRAEREGRKGK